MLVTRALTGKFIDDNTVGLGYDTPGLNTQFDYSNGLPNEIFPPYSIDQQPQWAVGNGPTVEGAGVKPAAAASASAASAQRGRVARTR